MPLDQVLQGSQFCAAFLWESLCLPSGDTATWLSTRFCRPLSLTACRGQEGQGSFLRHWLLYSVCEGRPRGQKSLEAAGGGCSSVSRRAPSVCSFPGRCGGRWRCGATLSPLRSVRGVTAWATLLFRHRTEAWERPYTCFWGGKLCLEVTANRRDFGVRAFGGSVWRSGHLVCLSAFMPSILAAAPRRVFSLMHFSRVWWLVMQYITRVSEVVHQAGTTSICSSLDTAKLRVDKSFAQQKITGMSAWLNIPCWLSRGRCTTHSKWSRINDRTHNILEMSDVPNPELCWIRKWKLVSCLFAFPPSLRGIFRFKSCGLLIFGLVKIYSVYHLI